MNKTLVRNLGGSALGAVARKYIGEGSIIDLKLGFALGRDRRVPVVSKMSALALGFVLTFVLEAFELPLETVLAFLLPVIGFGIDMAVDGVELITLPVLFGAALLPHLAPKAVVQRIRIERGSLIPVSVNNPERQR